MAFCHDYRLFHIYWLLIMILVFFDSFEVVYESFDSKLRENNLKKNQ